MRRKRNPEIIAGRVNGDGSIAAGDGFSVLKVAGVGQYAVTVAGGFRLVSAVASPAAFANQTANVSLTGGGTFLVQVYTANTAAGVDAAFTFVAVGVQQ